MGNGGGGGVGWNLHTFCTQAYHKRIFYLQSNSDKFNGYRFYTTLLLGLRKKILDTIKIVTILESAHFIKTTLG